MLALVIQHRDVVQVVGPEAEGPRTRRLSKKIMAGVFDCKAYVVFLCKGKASSDIAVETDINGVERKMTEGGWSSGLERVSGILVNWIGEGCRVANAILNVRKRLWTGRNKSNI